MPKMTKDASRLLEDALRLRPEDRVQLAEKLLASLDDVEPDVEQAWAAEVARRAAEARSSSTDEEDWRSALADVQREVLNR
jgi:putative addiction module component (TIGR02574 family)